MIGISSQSVSSVHTVNELHFVLSSASRTALHAPSTDSHSPSQVSLPWHTASGPGVQTQLSSVESAQSESNLTEVLSQSLSAAALHVPATASRLATHSACGGKLLFWFVFWVGVGFVSSTSCCIVGVTSGMSNVVGR